MRFLLPLLLFSIVGCTALAPHKLREQSIRIEPDQGKNDVIQILGKPGNRQFKGLNEAWQYCETSFTGSSGDDYLIVWFYDGKVTGVSTYNNYHFGTCESFFKTIRWEDSPDHIIEHRIR